MFVNYKTTGIFLKKIDKGEADQLFTVYTKDFGRVIVAGRGIRKIASKLRPGTEIFNVSGIEFIQGRTVKTLTDANPLEKFKLIRSDAQKTETAQKIVGVMDSAIRGEERDDDSWQLLLKTLLFLENAAAKDYDVIYHHFFWNLLAGLGYRPELYHCCSCRKKLAGSVLYFAPLEGGVGCGDCGRSLSGIVAIDPGILKILRLMADCGLEAILRLKLAPDQKNKLEAASKGFLSTIL